VEHLEEVAPLWRCLANAAKGKQEAIIHMSFPRFA
jgi:hypothetical protein